VLRTVIPRRPASVNRRARERSSKFNLGRQIRTHSILDYRRRIPLFPITTKRALRIPLEPVSRLCRPIRILQMALAVRPASHRALEWASRLHKPTGILARRLDHQRPSKLEETRAPAARHYPAPDRRRSPGVQGDLPLPGVASLSSCSRCCQCIAKSWLPLWGARDFCHR
jgi:hypothetical protein